MVEKKESPEEKLSGTVTGTSGGTGRLSVVRHLPESLAAEAAVLGSMLQDPECIGDVVDVVQRDSFYRIEHQYIFDALIHLYEANRTQGVDAVLLRDELEKRKQLEEIGGVEYISRILESC